MDGLIALTLAKNEAKAYTDTCIASLPKGIVFKGAVNYHNDLPASGQTVGDCYTVLYKGTIGTTAWNAEFAWGAISGTNQWIKIGEDGVSLEPYNPSATSYEENVLYYVVED